MIVGGHRVTFSFRFLWDVMASRSFAILRARQNQVSVRTTRRRRHRRLFGFHQRAATRAVYVSLVNEAYGRGITRIPSRDYWSAIRHCAVSSAVL